MLAGHEILVLIALASSECSDDPVHMYSLVRAFTSLICKIEKQKKARTKK